MRIIHGHDFYDSALAYGRDDNIVLVRDKNNFMTNNENVFDIDFIKIAPILFLKDEEIVPFIKVKVPNLYHSSGFSDGTFQVNHYFHAIKIVFCGKIYNGVYFGSLQMVHCPNEKFFWDLLTFEKWVNSIGYKFELKFNNEFTKIHELFSVTDVSKDVLNRLIEKRIVIITPYIRDDAFSGWAAVARPHGYQVCARINGDNLKYFQFFKKLDAFQAFQEIEMWIGGVLPKSGNPMVEITDNTVKIAKHGFDKFSFRKPKSPWRQKRRAEPE